MSDKTVFGWIVSSYYDRI